MNNLNISERSNKTKNGASKLRREGKVPGILYGEDINNMMFEISEMDLNREISLGGEHSVLNVNLNGTDQQALIKEVQREPVNHKIIHIDLERINNDKLVQSEIPIHFINEGTVTQTGGILQKEKTSVKVQCRADKLPKYLDMDLGKTKRDNVFRIADLEVASEITFLDDINSVIASMTEGNTNNVAIDNDAEEAVPEIPKKQQ